MKGLEISGENLEDLLAYDDLFLDYFNAFLALPVFPQALVYNRLTGAFEEVEEEDPLEQHPTSYGATDAEREKMLEWARHERLPMFLKTQLFRELKLVKLLLRPLEERQSASRGSSRNLRGYSRQTETYVSSLSNSVDNSAPDVMDDEDLWGELHYSALYRYQRPGSRALSVPIKCIHDDLSSSYEDEDDDSFYMSLKTPSSKKQQRKMSSGAKSAGKQASTEKRAARISSKVEVIPPADKSGKTRSSQRTKGPPASSTEEAFKKGARALSAPITYAHFLKMPPMDFADFDAMFGEDEPEPTGQTYVTFEDDHVSDEQTETDVRNMEGRFKMTLQQMKEHILCLRPGFEQYRDFLRDTSGRVLLDFWLDCEDFKDMMEDFDDHKQREIATMLFRDIQDKYKLKLTQDAKEQITRSTSNMALSHTIFLRTQYDVLRRLRAYWLPRFLTHLERTNTLDLDATVPEPPTAAKVLRPLRPSRPQAALFPTISLVNSMPVLPEEARNFSFSKPRGGEGGRGSISNVTRSSTSVPLRGAHKANARHGWRRRTVSSATLSNTYSRQNVMSRHTKDRFLLSLAQDRVAGGPFQRYLSKRLGDEQLLSCLLFWQDVTEYGATEDRSADRLLRLCHAWNIYNKYLSEDSRHKVEISEQDRLNLHNTLQSAREFIEASIFDKAKTLAVTKLEKAWVRFLKEDLKTFLDCRVRVGGESPPSTAEAIEITVTDQDVLIKRPRPWVRRIPGSAASERALRLRKALLMAEDIDDERRAQRRKEAQEKRKEMERERRKAVRAAYARQREAKKKGGAVSPEKAKGAEEGGEEASTVDGGVPEEEEKEKKGVTYQDLSANRQVMSMFRKYLSDQDSSSKEVQNLMHLYQEIEAYWATKDSKQKKDAVAAHIYKTYLDPQAKKFTQTSERISQRLNSEKERPRTGTLKEIQRSVLPRVEETFKDFLTQQAEELGVNPADLASMSQAELTMRMGSDQSLYTGWQKSGFKGHSRGKATGRAQPSREDRSEFLQALGLSAAGQPTISMLYFYKYLLKHGEEDGMPLLDKDLFFYIEVQKFKDISHQYSDEEMLKRKVQSVVDCFLDSVYSPSLQIDITSEMHVKTMKTAQRYQGGKDVMPSLFDEAQFYVFKELLPYWAGFRKSQGTPDQPKKRPMTKYQKMLKKRLENIENYEIPSKDFHLPRIPEGAVPSYTITLADGVKYREEQEMTDSIGPTPLPDARDRGSRMTVAPSVDNMSRRSRKLSVTKETMVSR